MPILCTVPTTEEENEILQVIGADMITFKGACENGVGNYFCEQCGAPMKTWEKIATTLEGECLTYVFRCKKCKKCIKGYNDKSNKV